MATLLPKARPATILVVDDNRHNRTLAENQLTDAGYRVVLAQSGAEALAIFEQEPPDLVLLDVMMPELDGFETCRRLRALRGGADTPVVFATALDESAALDTAMEVGGDDYLKKPIDRDELLIRVRSLIRIKRMGQELQRGYDALALLERQKTDLTQFVVHDLKSPLSAILANAQFAMSTRGLSASAHEALADVVGAVESMNGMLLNLLDIGRSEGGRLELHVQPVRIDVLVAEACHAVRARATERGVQLEVRTEPLSVDADRHVLRRVLDNLLDNALKYAPHSSPIQVDLASPSRTEALLSVQDRGDGIPHELKTRVFDRFVRLDAHATVQGRVSRGLGLAFCKLAVEAHGGAIWIDDAEPQGAVFRVRLPMG